jgi:hypothetical protein
MNSRCCFCVLLAAAHLVVVACGAADLLPDRGRQSLVRPLLWYARMTGADNQFSFYAPEVGDSFRTRFTLWDSQGGEWEASFEDTASPEARLRLSGIAFSAFANGAAVEHPEKRVRVVKSWAATMFSRYPRAIELTVVVEAYDIPTMAEYRGGQRPTWKIVYQAQVQRDASSPQFGSTP